MLERFAADFVSPAPHEGYQRILYLKPSDLPSPPYTCADIAAVLQRLATARQSPPATAHLVAGFQVETHVHFEEILREEVGAVGMHVTTIILTRGTEAPSCQDCLADPAARGPHLLRFLKTIAIQRVSQYIRKAPLLWLLESRTLRPEQRKVKSRRKGDGLAVAQVSALMAAKKTSSLIPLCHPLTRSHIDVNFTPELSQPGVGGEDRPKIICTAQVACEGRTGVVMEALAAVSVGLLTIWDTLKAVAGNRWCDGDK